MNGDARRGSLGLLIITLVATALRIPGLFTDFWGDEIWSWSIAGQMRHGWDVLLSTPARIDNNHPLNTLWLYAVGQHAPVWLYRLPSMFTGVGSVIVAAHCMARRSPAAAVVAAILVGGSFPFVFYSSEARGYADAAFFAFVAFDALDLAMAGGGWRSEMIFAIAASAGFLSHLTFLHVYGAALIWSAVVLGVWRGRRALLRLHALPIATALLLSNAFVRHMVIGGAPPTDPRSIILSSLSLILGGPGAGAGMVPVAIVTLTLFGMALRISWASRRHAWIFFLIAVLISPALTTVHELTIAITPQPLMLRYYFVCLAMLLLAIAPLIAGGWTHSPMTRRCVIAGGILFVIGSGIRLNAFWSAGRGHAHQALADIARATPTDPIVIGTDNLARTQLILSFEKPRMSSPRKIDLRNETGEWLVLNRLEATGPRIVSFDHHDYALVHAYPFDPLSGWSWVVYHR